MHHFLESRERLFIFVVSFVIKSWNPENGPLLVLNTMKYDDPARLFPGSISDLSMGCESPCPVLLRRFLSLFPSPIARLYARGCGVKAVPSFSLRGLPTYPYGIMPALLLFPSFLHQIVFTTLRPRPGLAATHSAPPPFPDIERANE